MMQEEHRATRRRSNDARGKQSQQTEKREEHLKIAFFWDLLPCGSRKTDVSEERTASIFRVE
jgi:hypothetical protein